MPLLLDRVPDVARVSNAGRSEATSAVPLRPTSASIRCASPPTPAATPATVVGSRASRSGTTRQPMTAQMSVSRPSRSARSTIRGPSVVKFATDCDPSMARASANQYRSLGSSGS